MTFFQALFLGLIQGLTEFLPVSSSGHLVIAQQLLPNFSQPGVLFDVVLHAGTVCAVMFYYLKTLLNLSKKMILLLLIGTFPAGLLGYLFNDFFEKLFSDISVVGITLVFTAIINLLTHTARSKSNDFNIRNSLIVGLAQAVAIIPGISRSGATIMAGTRLGINAQRAADFSFLLSVPAVLGAVFLQILKHGFTENIQPDVYLVGFFAALVSGYLAIKLVLQFLQKRKFIYFSFYTLILGLAVIIFL